MVRSAGIRVKLARQTISRTRNTWKTRCRFDRPEILDLAFCDEAHTYYLDVVAMPDKTVDVVGGSMEKVSMRELVEPSVAMIMKDNRQFSASQGQAG